MNNLVNPKFKNKFYTKNFMNYFKEQQNIIKKTFLKNIICLIKDYNIYFIMSC